MVRNWQKVPSIPKPKWRAGFRDLTVWAVNLGERVRVFPFAPDGTADPDAMDALESALRDRRTERSHPLDPRLVKLLYKTAVRFEARQINVISGYRESSSPVEGGHHADGTAVDFTVPGVGLASLAKYVRRLGHVGVGYYPVSGFVHLDVRSGPSYFWADRSGPGQGSCHRQIMAEYGPVFDRRWRPEHDEPEPRRNERGELMGGDWPPPEPADGGLVDAGPPDAGPPPAP